jgi:ABC-2 type transport system ATP-binding protein
LIAVEGLSKRYGTTLAVDDLTFKIEPGAVTGFLGPNGAGKTTTLRILLDLVHPTAGSATIDGRRYGELERPVHQVGAVLEAANFHPGRKGRNHLRVLARQAEIPERRVDETLALVGLSDAAEKRVKAYSLGMRQRLTIAGALLGEPRILILDEPANGLDPEGIRWLRRLLRTFADGGGTVFVSSHVLAEVAQLADRLVIIHRGRLVSHTSLEEIMRRAEGGVRVRSPESERLQGLLAGEGAKVAVDSPGVLTVHDAPMERIGELAAANGVVLHELSSESATLEDVFLELTGSGKAEAT